MTTPIDSTTKPLDLDFLLDQLYKLKRSRDLEYVDPPKGMFDMDKASRVDVMKLAEHGIGFAWIGESLVYIRPEDMKRAEEVGAVTRGPR